MASYDGSIVIKTAVDQTGIKTGIAGISSSLKKLAGTVAVAFGVRAIVNMGKAAINLASDLQEVQNVVDVSFGAMSYKIEEFSKTSIEQFGISELSAKSMASTFMAMGTGIGQGMEDGSDKAIELTARLADVMSFYNKSMSEVETIGRSVYSAETESLKQIGIIMTQTNLEAFALEQGYGSLYKNMDAANQLLVRQEFFLNATELAMGDFANTQDSWANSTRVLSERWNEFLTIIGSRLIQALTPVVNFLNTVLSAAINVATAISNILGFEAEVSTASSSVGGLSDAESDLASNTEEANSALKNQLAAFDDINVLNSSSGSSSSLTSGIGGGGTSVDYGETSVLGEQASELQMKLEPLVTAIKELFSAIGSFGGSFFKGFIDYFKELIGLDINDTAEGISSLAEAISKITPEQAENLGNIAAKLTLLFVSISVGSKIISFGSKVIAFFAGLKTSILSLGLTIPSVASALTYLFSVMNPAMIPALADFAVDKDIPFIADFILWLRGGWTDSDLGSSIDEFYDTMYEYFVSSLLTTFTFDNMFGREWTTQLAGITTDFFGDVADSFLEKDWIGLGKSLLSGILVGMVTVLAYIFEPIVAFVNGVINIVVAGVNSIIEAMNTIPGVDIDTIDFIGVAVPDTSYIENLYGGPYRLRPSDAGMPSSIPALASGAVIPPNNRFLAMLGDQTSGTNIEAPLDTIVEAMNISLGNRDGGNQEIILKIDETEIGRVMTPLVMSEQNRLGYDVAMMGV